MKERRTYERGSLPGEYDRIPGCEKYFRWGEFWRSKTAESLNVENKPLDPVVYERLQYLIEKVLCPLRYNMGPICLRSGYRSPAVNKAVGGVSRSFHAIGAAADIVPCMGNRNTTADLFKYIYENLPFTELIAEDVPGGWVHVAIEEGRESEKKTKLKYPGGPVKPASYEEIMRAYGR